MTLFDRAELTAQQQQILDLLKSKSRAEQDRILFEIERNLKNGDTIRNDNTGNATV